jgi:hypothetical protein
MTGIGALSVRINDVGNIPAGARANYTIDVVHP